MKWSLLVVSLLCAVVFSGDRSTYSAGATSPSLINLRWSPRQIRCDPARGTNPQMVQIRNFKNAWQIQRTCKFPDAEHVGFVVELFYKSWKHKFGDKENKVLKTLDNLMIEWGEQPKKILGGAFDVNGKPITGEAKGITLMPDYIWIWKEKYERIAATALIHELVHSALWAQSGLHGDPDHEGPEFGGWTPAHTQFIREINRLLAEIDI